MSVAWVGYLLIGTSGEIMVDGITISTIVVTVLSIVFSILSWFLFSWALRNVSLQGVMLSVVTGVVIITPFKGYLGPMAGILVGLVAGFAACMIQQKITTSKNKPLIVGLLTIVTVYVVMSALIISVQITSPWNTGDSWESWDESILDTNCGPKYMIVGNNECILDPEYIEPNTIVIYDVSRNNETRLAIAPHSLVMNLTGGDAVTFVNDGANTVNIFVSNGITTMPLFDNPKNILSFNDVKPSFQRALTINGTGYYKFLVQDSRYGQTGEIIALSDDANSLPIEIRAKMAQTIVGSDFRKESGLISVGSGGAEPGITIGIHEKFQDEPNAEQFYYEKYKKMIPFDVPIWIEFTSPIVPQTG